MKSCICLWLLIFVSQSGGMQLRGSATTLDSKTLIYNEDHDITLDPSGLNQIVTTRYSKPDGKVFATMTSDFLVNKTVPSIDFEDLRFNKKQQLLFSEDNKKVIFKSTLGSAATQVKSYPYDAQMVAGQGFDNFVKINFQSLKKGSIPMLFGVLSELDFFSFEGHQKNKTDKNIQFGIQIKNFFMGLFLNELLVEYDSETKQIISFRGLSNIADDKGKAQNVLIKYEIRK